MYLPECGRGPFSHRLGLLVVCLLLSESRLLLVTLLGSTILRFMLLTEAACWRRYGSDRKTTGSYRSNSWLWHLIVESAGVDAKVSLWELNFGGNIPTPRWRGLLNPRDACRQFQSWEVRSDDQDPRQEAAEVQPYCLVWVLCCHLWGMGYCLFICLPQPPVR